MLVGRDGDGCWWVYDSYERSGMLIDDILKFIDSKKEYNPSIIIDPSAAGLIATVQSKGYVSVIKATNDVNLGIDKVRDAMARSHLRIGASCKGLVSGLRGYMYGDDHKPVKVNDHQNDGLRYVISTITGMEEAVAAEKVTAPRTFFSIA